MGLFRSIGFLEILLIVFALYLVTQILIPYIWPKDFERNWLFKKKKPLGDKIDILAKRKEILKSNIEDTKAELRERANEVDKADKELNEL